MTEKEVMAYLESVNGKNIKLGLENVTAFIEAIGRPDETLKIIHVAGTNGKGSVCEMMSQMLQSSGYKVGTFNSPYFEKPNECIRINNRCISDGALMGYMNEFEPLLEELENEDLKPSGFEILTGMALLYFKNQKVDFVILEVGLGGRLDATNVIKQSCLSVITKIAMDHTNFLGNSLEAIALEKAGIIKSNGIVVTPKQNKAVMKAFDERCSKQNATLFNMLPEAIEQIQISEMGTKFNYRGETYTLSMIGGYQAYNASLAIEAMHVLDEQGWISTSLEKIKEGLKQAKWPGRFEKVSTNPLCFLDGAHNVDGMQALVDTLKELPKRYTIAILGILGDKSVDQMLKIISPYVDAFVVTKPLNPRALSVKELADKIRKNCLKAEIYEREEIPSALEKALELGQEVENPQLIGCGSLYMLGGLRPLLIKK